MEHKPHIHIIAPSGAIDPQLITEAEAKLREWGYHISEGRFARGHYGRFAGTREERLADLNDALRDEDIDIILCARGGYGLQQLLPDIRVERNIPVVGFSDITALHRLMNIHGIPSLHAQMCKHIATLPDDAASIRYLRDALMGKPIHYQLPTHPLCRMGEAHGQLIGGNLSVLYGLQGTPYALTSEDKPILLLEDISERHYHIDRMMQNLRMSGLLARLGGLIVGQFTDCEDDPTMHQTVLETIRAAVDDYSYPVLMNFPSGHVTDNYPLWLGRDITIRIKETYSEIQQ